MGRTRERHRWLLACCHGLCCVGSARIFSSFWGEGSLSSSTNQKRRQSWGWAMPQAQGSGLGPGLKPCMSGTLGKLDVRTPEQKGQGGMPRGSACLGTLGTLLPLMATLGSPSSLPTTRHPGGVRTDSAETNSRRDRPLADFQDNSAETLERCWVVFEAALAHELGKDGPRDGVLRWDVPEAERTAPRTVGCFCSPFFANLPLIWMLLFSLWR